MINLSELEAKAQAATPGPWYVWEEEFVMSELPEPEEPHNNQAVAYGVRDGYGATDANFIVAANPQTILALIADLRQARALMRMAADELNNIHAHFKAGHTMIWDNAQAVHDELLSALDSAWVKP